jgi:DNA-binding PadR family transcriptional regulator
MLYDILATLWERPAPAEHLHQAVAFRTGTLTSAQSLERYLQLLAECGYVNALDRSGAQVYALAERGSLLLADFAQARDSAHTQPIHSEA